MGLWVVDLKELAHRPRPKARSPKISGKLIVKGRGAKGAPKPRLWGG